VVLLQIDRLGARDARQVIRQPDDERQRDELGCSPSSARGR
jgi:hypothetical protein